MDEIDVKYVVIVCPDMAILQQSTEEGYNNIRILGQAVSFHPN